MLRKINLSDKEELRAKYLEYYEEHIGTQVNKMFFSYVRSIDIFADLSDARIIGILVSQKVYKPTSPRVMAKKKGITKAHLIAQLVELTSENLTSLDKLNMFDLEALIKAIGKK